jgi:hypothetical protein
MYHSSMLIAKKFEASEERIDRLFLGVSTPLCIMAHRFVLFLLRKLDRRPARPCCCCSAAEQCESSSDIIRANSERHVMEDPTRACRRTYDPLLLFFWTGSGNVSSRTCTVGTVIVQYDFSAQCIVERLLVLMVESNNRIIESIVIQSTCSK